MSSSNPQNAGRMWSPGGGPTEPVEGDPPPPPVSTTCVGCGVTDAFDRVLDVGWGTSDAGLVWEDSGSGGGSSVDGVGHLWVSSQSYPNQAYQYETLTGDFTHGTMTFNLTVIGEGAPTGTASQSVWWWLIGPGYMPSFGYRREAGGDVLYLTTSDQAPVYAASTPFHLVVGTKYHVNWQVEPGVAQRLKVWTGSDEPTEWTLVDDVSGVVTSSTYATWQIGCGNFGGGSGNSTNGEISVEVDNLDIPGVNRCSAIQFDDFNRVVANGWGLATNGVPWSISNGPANAFSVDGNTGYITKPSGTPASRYDIYWNDNEYADAPWWSWSTWSGSGQVPTFSFTAHIGFRAVSAIPTTGTLYIAFVIGGLNIEAWVANNATGSIRCLGEEAFKSDWVSGQLYEFVITYDVATTLWTVTMGDLTLAPIGGWGVGDSILGVIVINDGTGANGTVAVDYIEFDYDGKPCYGPSCGPTAGTYGMIDDFNRTAGPDAWGTTSSGTATWYGMDPSQTAFVDGTAHLVTDGTEITSANLDLGVSDIAVPFVLAMDVVSWTGTVIFFEIDDNGSYPTRGTAYLFFQNSTNITYLVTTESGAWLANGWYASTTTPPSDGSTIYISTTSSDVTVTYGGVSLSQPWRRGDTGDAMTVPGSFRYFMCAASFDAGGSSLVIDNLRAKDGIGYGVRCDEPVYPVAVG